MEVVVIVVQVRVDRCLQECVRIYRALSSIMKRSFVDMDELGRGEGDLRRILGQRYPWWNLGMLFGCYEDSRSWMRLDDKRTNNVCPTTSISVKNGLRWTWRRPLDVHWVFVSTCPLASRMRPEAFSGIVHFASNGYRPQCVQMTSRMRPRAFKETSPGIH